MLIVFEILWICVGEHGGGKQMPDHSICARAAKQQTLSTAAKPSHGTKETRQPADSVASGEVATGVR